MLVQNLFAVLFSCLFSISLASSTAWYALIKGTKHRILVQAGPESLLLNGKSDEGNKMVPFLNIKNEVIEIASVNGVETKILFPNTPSSVIKPGKLSLPYSMVTFGCPMSVTIQAPSLQSAQEFVQALKKNITEQKMKVEALEKANKSQEEQKSLFTASASLKPKNKKKNKKKSATNQVENSPELFEEEETEEVKTEIPAEHNSEQTDITAQVIGMMEQVKIEEKDEESNIDSTEQRNKSPVEHSEPPSKNLEEVDIASHSQPAISSDPRIVFTEVPGAKEIQKKVEEGDSEKTDIPNQLTEMMEQARTEEESNIDSMEKRNESPVEHCEHPSPKMNDSDDHIVNDSQPAISGNPQTVAMSAFTEVPRAEELQKEVEEAEEEVSAEYERIEPADSIGNGEPEATLERPKNSESEQPSWYWRILGY